MPLWLLVGLVVLVLAAGGVAMNVNLAAALALIRRMESGNDYTVIAGGDHFADFSEHPFILEPTRPRPLGTTASGAYQIVKQTWIEARNALELPDFSPASQDKAAAWLIQRRGALDAIVDGRFDDAFALLSNEWEAIAKMLAGEYHITRDQALEFIGAHGGRSTEEV